MKAMFECIAKYTEIKSFYIILWPSFDIISIYIDFLATSRSS